MADIRIKDLPETSDVGADDYVAVDNAGDGTRKFTLRQLVASVGTPEFVVNVNASGEADKTLSEINTAISNGYVPVVLYDGGYYQLAETTETAVTFTKCTGPIEMAEISITSSAVRIETNTLTSDDIDNDSGVIGENVSDALDNLEYSITNFSETVASVQTMTEDHEMAIYDLDTRVTTLESGGGGGGDGLTQTEKNLILALFEKAAYAENDAGSAYDQLESLWVSSTKTITYNLSHVTSGNTETSIESGRMYTTEFAVDGGYTINSVVVTMGGEDITSTAYRSGTITIPRVTGNIVITASAVLAAQSITATYTQSGTVYDTATLDSLKADLAVTANYAGGTSETLSSSDYTLSGTLEVGTSTITVGYAGLTTTFNVTVTHAVQDTTAQIATSGEILIHLANAYETRAATNGGITVLYEMDAATTTLFPAGIIPTDSVNDLKNGNNVACLFIYDSTGEPINFVNELTTSSLNRWAQDRAGTMTEYSNSYTVTSYSKIAFSVDTRYLDDAYMYDKTTGQVWFAGINTPYYGMTNISQASS